MVVVFAIPCLFNKQLHELLFIKQIMFNIFHRTFPRTLSLPIPYHQKHSSTSSSNFSSYSVQYILLIYNTYSLSCLFFFCLKTSSFLSLEHELSFSPWILYLSWNLLLFPDTPLTVHPM